MCCIQSYWTPFSCMITASPRFSCRSYCISSHDCSDYFFIPPSKTSHATSLTSSIRASVAILRALEYRQCSPWAVSSALYHCSSQTGDVEVANDCKDYKGQAEPASQLSCRHVQNLASSRSSSSLQVQSEALATESRALLLVKHRSKPMSLTTLRLRLPPMVVRK